MSSESRKERLKKLINSINEENIQQMIKSLECDYGKNYLNLTDSLCDIRDIKVKVNSLVNKSINKENNKVRSKSKNNQEISNSYKKSQKNSKIKKTISRSRSKKKEDPNYVQVESSLICEVDGSNPFNKITIKTPCKKEKINFSNQELESKDIKLNIDILLATRPETKIKKISAHANYDDQQSDYLIENKTILNESKKKSNKKTSQSVKLLQSAKEKLPKNLSKKQTQEASSIKKSFENEVILAENEENQDLDEEKYNNNKKISSNLSNPKGNSFFSNQENKKNSNEKPSFFDEMKESEVIERTNQEKLSNNSTRKNTKLSRNSNKLSYSVKDSSNKEEEQNEIFEDTNKTDNKKKSSHNSEKKASEGLSGKRSGSKNYKDNLQEEFEENKKSSNESRISESTKKNSTKETKGENKDSMKFKEFKTSEKKVPTIVELDTEIKQTGNKMSSEEKNKSKITKIKISKSNESEKVDYKDDENDNIQEILSNKDSLNNESFITEETSSSLIEYHDNQVNTNLENDENENQVQNNNATTNLVGSTRDSGVIDDNDDDFEE